MSAFKKLIDKLEKYSMEYMNDYIYAATTQLYYNRTKDLVEKIDKESWNGMEDDDERYEETQQVAEELLDFWLPGITRINFEQGSTFPNDLDLEFHDAVRTFYAEKYDDQKTRKSTQQPEKLTVEQVKKWAGPIAAGGLRFPALKKELRMRGVNPSGMSRMEVKAELLKLAQ